MSAPPESASTSRADGDVQGPENRFDRIRARLGGFAVRPLMAMALFWPGGMPAAQRSTP